MDTMNKNSKSLKSFGFTLMIFCLLAITFAYGCDQACFDTCTLTKDLKTCSTSCGCPQEGTALNDQLKKNQRCYGECRHSCSFNLFTNGDTQGKLDSSDTDCFGSCTCICNRGCTASCETAANKYACLQGCGCPSDQNKTDALLAKSKTYFDLPLDPRGEEEISAEFQGKFVDLISTKYKKTEKKSASRLNKHYEKLEKKWNDYVSHANRIGVNPTVFCNTTCSHECFSKMTENGHHLLFGCLMNQCKCFYPNLPRHHGEISFEAIMELRNMIEDDVRSKVSGVMNKVKSHIPEERYNHIPERVRNHLFSNLAYNQEVGVTTVDTPPADVVSPVEATPESPSTQTVPIPVPEPAIPTEVSPTTGPVAAEPVVAEPVVVEPVVVEPVAPTVVNPYENQTHSEILSDPTDKAEECDLFCFDECLKLKKYVTFPVIKQCITVKCHCDLDAGIDKLQEYLSLNSMDTLSSASQSNAKSSVFTHQLLTLFVLAIMGGSVYLLFKYITEKESLKRTSYKDDMEYTQNTGYEPMHDESLSHHF